MGICILNGCGSKEPPSIETEIIKLEDFETVVAIDDKVIAIPSVIEYGGKSNIFVYDKQLGKVLELNGEGQIIHEYGRRGRGPGEFIWVNNFFLTTKYLYVVDNRQFMVHKYRRGGGFISSFDYGKIVGNNLNIPPAPFSAATIYAEDIRNMPFVTLQGNVLLSATAVKSDKNAQHIYELRDWEGNKITNIGYVPEGSSFILDYDNLREDVENREIPAFYKPQVFVVLNQATEKEFFFIYNSFPKIIKYNNDGKELWERKIDGISEIDSIKTNFYETMDRMRSSSRSRIVLEYYVAGTSDNQGNLYLIMDSDPVRVHQFNKQGELTQRYKLISNVELVPIIDVDTGGNRIFIVTEEGEIRAYQIKNN